MIRDGFSDGYRMDLAWLYKSAMQICTADLVQKCKKMQKKCKKMHQGIAYIKKKQYLCIGFGNSPKPDDQIL